MLRRPRWIAATLVVLALAVTFVSLGLWQLRRLDERQAYNAKLTARMSMPVVDLDATYPTSPISGPTLGEMTYRRVTVRGVYDTDEEVLLLSRSRNSLAGHHVLTPLVTRGGYAVIVDRGWVPFKTYTMPVAEALPPVGEVTVTGVFFPGQVRGRFGPKHAPGELDGVWRVDLDRLAEQIDEPLFGLWLHQQEQRPARTKELPKPVDLPKLDEGPHRSYAIQWFAFAATVLIGYGALVRRERRKPEEAA